MAIDDIGVLREQLPDLFESRGQDEILSDNYVLVPVEDPELGDITELGTDDELDTDAYPEAHEPSTSGGFVLDRGREPPIGIGGEIFGGAYRQQDPGEPVPPPDAMAFYLPFHHYYPRWWGIYLVAEAVREFGDWISAKSSGVLSRAEGFAVARLFVYGHEAFHHVVEAYATRLEVTHRTPLYRIGFQALYARTVGTDNCLEEALADAAGLRKVSERAFRTSNQPAKRRKALEVLRHYVKLCPPGYRRGGAFVANGAFSKGRNEFAEENFRTCLPTIPSRDPGIWSTFPHAFSGIARVTSRVNYVVHRSSRLATRSGLGLRYLRHRDVVRRLQRLAGCSFIRHDGPHEIWKNASGQRFAIPNHRGDLPDGTLAKIVKQAGLEMSLREFMNART